MAFEIKQVVNQSVKKGADSCRRALKSNPSETKLTVPRQQLAWVLG